MCRIAAYLGPPAPLSDLIDGPHGLEDQARHAREMSGGQVAGDGWGIGWFPQDQAAGPGLIKSVLPIWSDLNAKVACPAIRSGSIVGHVRLASPGVETSFLNTPLYALDGHLWTVNGELTPWPGPLARALRGRLDPEHEAEVKGSTDAEMLGALWRTCLRRTGGRDAAGAVRQALAIAHDLARAHGGTLKTNIILAARSAILAVRHADEGPGNSLYTLRRRGASLVASEPLDDDPAWRPVEPATLVRLSAEGIDCEPLGLTGGRVPAP